MATVSFQDVCKSYRSKKDDVRAVDRVNLDVADREFVVLVGPSGCGKTTTLRLVAGLEEIDAGTIRIADDIVNDVAPKDRDIAMVFQNYALYPHMTVFKNMAFGLKMRRFPRDQIKRRVGKVADLLGIEHLLDRKPAALSGGEQQRVALGRAIVRRPRVFLFDEPLSNLDAKLRIHMRTEIKALHQNIETTILYVTHDQEEAMTLGDRLVIMDKGVVQQCGAPLKVYNCPANRFVAGFVGTPPMNFLAGRLERKGESLCFAGPIGLLQLPAESAGALRSHAGQDVVLGIRPEHLALDGISAHVTGTDSGSSTHNNAVIQAKVSIVEPLGDSIHVHLVGTGGEKLVARAPPTVSVGPGLGVDVSVDMAHVHFFSEGDHGRRLGEPPT